MESKAKKKTQRTKLRRAVLWTLALLLVVGAAVGCWLWSTCRTAYDGEECRIYIPRGSTADAVADTLRARLGDDYASEVLRLLSLQGDDAREGSYVVAPGTTALTLSRTLRYGRQTPVRVTYNNIRTLDQLAARVTASLEISPDDFLAACDSVLPAAGFTRQTYPAAFLPDTYEFYWDAPATTVVQRLLDHRNAYWTDERRAQAAALGLTPVQVATLASIVEEETNKDDERGMVARLYLNRLQRSMKLQADPTVKFALGDFSLRRIYERHLQCPSPYNTYMHEGLPPGPIRVADRRTLDTVLDAPEHQYLYMCAKEDFSGYHNFATDYATHQANARRYRRELDRRGI